MPLTVVRRAREDRLAILALSALLLVLVLVLLPTQRASAHPTGSTGVFLTVRQDAVDVKMQIQKAGFVAATGYDIATEQSELDAISDNLMTFLLHRVHISDERGALTASVLEKPTFATVNDEDAIETTLQFTADRPLQGALEFTDDFIIDVVPSHQVYVALVSDWDDGQVAEGDPQVIGVLGGGVTHLTWERSDTNPLHGLVAVIRLGMLHIAEGTDHLLFLTTLLIVAPSLATRARRGWRWQQPIPVKRTIGRAALTITAFTVGHLITLALVSLGLVSFPEKPVEILVAVSIAVAAAHALKPLLPRGELLIAGVFGLVHGTAFATTILELNLGFGETLVAIIGFNVGVELAQLIAAVLVLPLLIWLSHARAFAGFRTAVAIAAIIAAAAWIVGILTDQDSALQPVFTGIGSFPIVSYLLLVGLVAALWYFTRHTASSRRIEVGQ